MVVASVSAVHAPHLIDTEVLHVLRRWRARGELSQARADAAVTDLATFPVVHYAHGPLRERVWALRGKLSAYDATYVALAEALDATFVTNDRRLARACDDLVETVCPS